SPVTEPASTVSRIREHNLTRIVDEMSDFCYYRSTTSYHFLTPSLKHCTRFLRVGNLIRSVPVLDRLAFWILPDVAVADVLLIDSWSIVAGFFLTPPKKGVQKTL